MIDRLQTALARARTWRNRRLEDDHEPEWTMSRNKLTAIVAIVLAVLVILTVVEQA